MIDFNNTILAIAVVVTILLAIVNVMQIVMANKGVNPLNVEGNQKYVFIIVIAALIILLIAHIVTSIGNDGVGKDNALLMAGGGLALIFAITTMGCFMMKDKLEMKVGDKAQYVYFGSLALLWICLIIHIVARVQL